MQIGLKHTAPKAGCRNIPESPAKKRKGSIACSVQNPAHRKQAVAAGKVSSAGVNAGLTHSRDFLARSLDLTGIYGQVMRTSGTNRT